MNNNWGKGGVVKEGVARRGFTVFHFYRIKREDGCTQVYLGYYVHFPKAIIIYHLPGVTRRE